MTCWWEIAYVYGGIHAMRVYVADATFVLAKL